MDISALSIFDRVRLKQRKARVSSKWTLAVVI